MQISHCLICNAKFMAGRPFEEWQACLNHCPHRMSNWRTGPSSSEAKLLERSVWLVWCVQVVQFCTAMHYITTSAALRTQKKENDRHEEMSLNEGLQTQPTLKTWNDETSGGALDISWRACVRTQNWKFEQPLFRNMGMGAGTLAQLHRPRTRTTPEPDLDDYTELTNDKRCWKHELAMTGCEQAYRLESQCCAATRRNQKNCWTERDMNGRGIKQKP